MVESYSMIFLVKNKKKYPSCHFNLQEKYRDGDKKANPLKKVKGPISFHVDSRVNGHVKLTLPGSDGLRRTLSDRQQRMTGSH